MVEISDNVVEDNVADDNPQQPPPAPLAEEAYKADITLLGVPLTVRVMTNGLKLIDPDQMAGVIAAVSRQSDLEKSSASSELASFGQWLAKLPLVPPHAGD